MTTKTYCQRVSVPDQTKTHLLACYHNHLGIYNEMVDYYFENQSLTYKDIKVKLEALVQEGRYSEVVRSALCNEIYYLYKKADFLYKSIDDIQYLSGIANQHYRGKAFVYEEGSLELRVAGVDLPIILQAPLPVVQDGLDVYINLSYSGADDEFELSIFTTPELNKERVLEPSLIAA